MNKMISAAKKAEADWDHFHGDTVRRQKDEEYVTSAHVLSLKLSSPFSHSRDEVLKLREEVIKQAAHRNVTDPAKIIIAAIPRYYPAASGAQNPLSLKKLRTEQAVRKALDMVPKDSIEVTIVEVPEGTRLDQ